ncbi:MAG: AmmeMemoRadiSam system protein B [Bacillota bacterium]
MSIVMAGLSPHPPLIIPEIGGQRLGEVQDTVDSLQELSREMVDCKPDLLITISPHGQVFQDAVSVLDEEVVCGDLGDFGHPEVSFREVTDQKFIEKLTENSQQEGIELVTLSEDSVSNSSVVAELDHGVMVPLYYLREAGLDVPLIALTMGLLSYHELYEFGNLIQDVVAQSDLDALVLASGDLSHRLKPGAPAGYNPRGEVFDKKLVQLLEEKRFKEVLDMDPDLIRKAGECGLRPLIIMLGCIRDLKLQVDVKSYEGPFGVGYAVAGFHPEEG